MNVGMVHVEVMNMARSWRQLESVELENKTLTDGIESKGFSDRNSHLRLPSITHPDT
jgi:hypothetical protein